MKVKINVTFAMEFDSEGEGKSSAEILFKLPDHPKLEISDTVKKLAIEEVRMLSHAMIEREVFSPEFKSQQEQLQASSSSTDH